MSRWGVALFIAACAWADSRECAQCHRAIWETYQKTGMARSFSRAKDVPEATFDHAASGMRVSTRDRSIEYVLGSGNHAKTFLHRNALGELIELPLGWYAEKGGYFAMNPGYDRADHEAYSRRIGYECMFCHNAYPQVPKDSGPRSAPVYLSLPEGIDCARCHGDGEHPTLVNPRKLSRDRQLDICQQCHLETTSEALPGQIVRYERGPFSFRPGEKLSDFALYFDRLGDRFEINSSAYRLRKSLCFVKSEMTCTTCHDPHGGKRDFEAACKSCHVPAHASTGCVGCHMPKRRTEDAVHVVMTDHFIQRVAREQLEERAEKPPVEYRGEVLPYGDSVEIYTAIANLKSGTARLRGAIERERPANPEYYLQLGDFVPGSVAALERRAMVDASLWPEVLRLDPQNVAAWVRYGVVSGSVEALEKAVALDPESDAAHAGLASVLMNRDPGRALREALEAVRLHPNDPGDRFVAALALSRMRRFVDARMQLDAALKIEPGRADLHRLYGNVLGASGDLRGAVAHFREVVRIEPGSARANFDLGMALQESGQTSAAQEFLRRAASLLWPLWVAVKS